MRVVGGTVMRVLSVRMTMVMVMRVRTISTSPPHELSDPTGDQHQSQQRNQCVAQRLEVSRCAVPLAQFGSSPTINA